MKQFLFLCMGLLLMLSCKKQEVEPTPGDESTSPVFHFNGNVDGSFVNLNAGLNDYYMYASYSQDTAGMYSFTGNLKQVHCVTNCNSISFQINDNRRSSKGGSSNIDSLLPGTYKYLTDTTNVASNFIDFKSDPMLTYMTTTYFWDFGDGTTSTLQNPKHAYLSPGIYNVCHTINYQNGCGNTICNQVKAISLSDCMAFIENKQQSDSIIFDAIANGNNPTYSWNFGDTSSASNTSTMKSPAHVYSSPGIYKVRLDVITSDNCSTTVFKNVVTPKYFIGCYSNFTYSKQYVPVPAYFSNVIVTYRDQFNAIYTSRTTQPSDSYFEILSTEEYWLNENNARTKKLRVRFKCNVSDGKRVCSITDGNAVIAVAYP